MKNRKILSSIFLALFCAAAAFADLPEKIIKEQVSAIKSEMDGGKISEAYEKTNVLLRSFENPQVFPGNVTALSIQVYEKYLSEIERTKNYNLIEEVDSNLQIFSGISTSALKVKVEKIKSELRNQKSDEQNKMQFSALNSVKIWLILIFAAILILFLAFFVPFFMISRKSRIQMKDFDKTLRSLSGLQEKNSRILLDALTEIDSIQNQKTKEIGWGKNELPSPEMTAEEKDELRNLALKCEKLGEKIDKATNRKNNSKNVSELVYKLAVRLGLNQNSAKIYFCAAMVYDAGFLALPENLLKSENLSEEQRKILQSHVEKYSDYLGFVPKKYWRTFEKAAKYHHENIDGSGYPEGLRGKNIPQVARLIRVAESYVSLVSLRSYKKICDKESAVKELESKPEFYDTEVANALDSIV